MSMAITMFVFVFIGQAADVRFKVAVFVTCKDEHTKTFIESHIKRELRALVDVDIVKEKDALYFLSVVAVEPVYKSTGRKVGDIAIAYNYYKLYAPLDTEINSLPDGFIKLYIENRLLFHAPQLGVYTCDKPDLDGTCKEIVVQFDQNQLEPRR